MDIKEKAIKVKFKWKDKEEDLDMEINDDITRVYLPNGFPKDYFEYLRRINSLSYDSEERSYEIAQCSLEFKIDHMNIIFKKVSMTNLTGDIIKIIIEEKH